jgi:ribosomal protein S18 acetylase RimI-like enzyme
MIIYSDSKEISTEKLDSLFQSIGWKRDRNKWQKVLEKSTHITCAYDNDRLVGFGRVLEDGVMCMFYDLGVHPDYRGKGIGTSIMEKLIDKVKDKGYASIGLFAWKENPDNIPFYEKFGFEKSSGGMELKKYMTAE